MYNIPLISCLMPTADRPHYVPMAIKNFLKQDYPNLELVIIDDGVSTVEQLLPADPRINYIRKRDAFKTIGEKRNFACQNAKGEILVHWDDDDWYSRTWISEQHSILLESSADIVGLNQLYFYSVTNGRSWLYRRSPEKKTWVAGATLAYYKSFWKENPFVHFRVGEDNQFVLNTGARVTANPNIKSFVSLIHRTNTSPKNTSEENYNEQPQEIIAQILGEDLLTLKNIV